MSALVHSMDLLQGAPEVDVVEEVLPAPWEAGSSWGSWRSTGCEP